MGKDFSELADITENVATKKQKTEEEVKAEKTAKIEKKKKEVAKTKGGVTKKKDAKPTKAPKIQIRPRKPKMYVSDALIPKIDPVVRDCMKQGYALACVASRPGQCGVLMGTYSKAKNSISTGRRWTKRSKSKWSFIVHDLSVYHGLLGSFESMMLCFMIVCVFCFEC